MYISKANERKNMASVFKNKVNIGKDTETKLIRAGIDSFEKLTTLGSEQAFIRLQTIDPGACINLLYALEGAILGVKSNKLPLERKQVLLQFFRAIKKK